MKDLKQRTLRGGLAKICAQGTNLLLRVGSLMVLARLLDPKDFGLVGMVTALTGVLNLFRDFGLSAAAVQRASVTEEQTSTLFWINVLVGSLLTVSMIAMAPVVAAFYHEPRLFWVTAALALGFVFNAVGVQHSAMLQRQMRFTAISANDIIALTISTVTGIFMALRGYGYWSLVVMTVMSPILTSIGLWWCTAWIPGPPRRKAGIRSLMRFGGTMTLNGLVVYVAYNMEKVLLGRFWGAEAVGIYGRSYQLVNIPTDNLNSAVGEVAFSALSRVQDEPSRLRSYFLKGYSLVVGLTLPVTILCALFSHDLIAVVLGAKWNEAAPIFRLLAPTILIFAMINPFSWLLFSMGMVGRSLKIALAIAPLVISGYVIGLPWGPKGVALGYSAAMALWIVPHIVWCTRGTPVSVPDVIQTLSRPLISGVVAAALPLALQLSYLRPWAPLPRLIVGGALFAAVYLVMLLYVMGQKVFYLDIVRGLRGSSSTGEKAYAVA